jgi:hypothetical protein
MAKKIELLIVKSKAATYRRGGITFPRGYTAIFADDISAQDRERLLADPRLDVEEAEMDAAQLESGEHDYSFQAAEAAAKAIEAKQASDATAEKQAATKKAASKKRAPRKAAAKKTTAKSKANDKK